MESSVVFGPIHMKLFTKSVGENYYKGFIFYDTRGNILTSYEENILSTPRVYDKLLDLLHNIVMENVSIYENVIDWYIVNFVTNNY